MVWSTWHMTRTSSLVKLHVVALVFGQSEMTDDERRSVLTILHYMATNDWEIDPDTDQYDKGLVHVYFDDNETVVCRLSDINSRITEWTARFTATTPATVIIDVLKAAE